MTAVAREHIAGGARAARLASGLAAGATSLTVEAGGLASWPDGSVGRIPVILDQGLASEEHLYATARSGDTLTGLIRGQDGTVDQAHAANATVLHGLFSEHINRVNELLSAPTAKGELLAAGAPDDWRVHAAGPNNAILVADPTQASGLRWSLMLTGMALAAPTIADLTNMQHDHLDADDGGTLPVGAIAPLGVAWGAWAATVPTLTGITLGNGTLTARVRAFGRTVHFVVDIVAGSTTTVSGTVRVGLPFLVTGVPHHGAGRLIDANGTTYAVVAIADPAVNTEVATPHYVASGMAPITGTAPFTWAAGDRLSFSLTYETNLTT